MYKNHFTTQFSDHFKIFTNILLIYMQPVSCILVNQQSKIEKKSLIDMKHANLNLVHCKAWTEASVFYYFLTTLLTTTQYSRYISDFPN